MAPPQPPSLDLPKPPADLRASRKGDRVFLTWTNPTATTDRQTIRILGPTGICRTLTSEMRECGTPIGKFAATKANSLKQAAPASFTDTITDLEGNDAAAAATYAVEVPNPESRSAGLSNRVRVPLIHTLPAPQNFQAKVTKEGIGLNWTAEIPNAPSGVHYVFRILRSGADSKQTAVGEVAAADSSSYTFTDSQIEWEKTYDYFVEAVTVIPQAGKPNIQVEGDDTPVAKVFADDVFPPAMPTGLQAVFSGPGQQPFIDLVWAPVSDVDLAGYNVYRHTEGTAAAKINSELVKTPAYRDANVQAGNRYYYSVSAVDLRGNESAQSDEANESVPQ